MNFSLWLPGFCAGPARNQPIAAFAALRALPAGVTLAVKSDARG
jgi:hypothetical protein